MSKIALVFWIALATPPNPQPGGSITPSKMASRPLPDNSLAQSTVSVLVRKGASGAEGVEVWMLPAGAAVGNLPATDGALTEGKTNAEGRVFLKGAIHAGRQVEVWVKLGQKYQRSVPFQIPAVGGVRLLFVKGAAAPHGTNAGGQAQTPPQVQGRGQRPDPGQGSPHGHNHGAAQPMPKGPLTKDPSNLHLWISFRIMAIENEKIYLALTYSVVNRGRETFHAGDHGLLLPMPEGAKGVSLPRGTRGASVVKGKIMSLNPVATGRHGLRLQASCHLVYKNPEQLVRIRSHLPLIGYSVSLKKYRTVRIGSKDLTKPESFKHGSADTPWLVYRAKPDGFPRNEIRFQIEHLPVRSRLGAWLFASLALLLLLAAIGLSIARRRRPHKPASQSDESANQPTDELVTIERDRLLGVIDDAKAKDLAKAHLKQS
jgi:hypothetical protein